MGSRALFPTFKGAYVSINESDYYVLVNAATRAYQSGQGLMKVRTTTLYAIGAGDLVSSADASTYEQLQDDQKDLHTSEVQVFPLKEKLEDIEPTPSE